jgi:phage gpG-like protein
MFIVETYGDGASSMRAKLGRLSDHRRLLPDGAKLILESMQSNILESRTPSGEPYPPLKHPRPTRLGAGIADGWGGDIVRRKVEPHPYADKPLLDTTNMFQSLHFEILNENEALIGPSMAQAPYFPNQNQGAPARNIPARTFIGIRVEDHATLEFVVVRHTLAALAA